MRKTLLFSGLLMPFIINAQDLSAYQNRKQWILDGYKYMSGWTEQILNDDSTINWTQYENVASNAGDSDMRDYLLGPRYSYYHHPTATKFPTLELQGNEDGWEGPESMKPPVCFTASNTNWYAQSGPLLYVADNPGNAGVVKSANGECYIYSGSTPPWGFYNRLYWEVPGDRHRYRYSVPPELSQPDWNSPKKPIAVASANGIAANQAIYVAFENGFIGTMPVDPIEYTFINNNVGNNGGEENYENAYSTGPTKNIFPSVQLPAGKVPMALAVTPCGEFVLAAVWDVVNHKGQLAVIAVQGRVRCSETVYHDWNSLMSTGTWMYGFPCWPTTKGLKLLGFVDLPVAAPMAIKAGTNMGWQNNGRWEQIINANTSALLDSQSERNTWYSSDPAVYPNYKATAHAGYAIISSRSENKVVFVDLQPLFQYYRNMYFTTQELYDETKNVGLAADQWPYTFDHTPGQMPVVTYTLDIPAPTAVATGLSIGHCFYPSCPSCNASWNPFRLWRVTPYGDQYAYVTTMDGKLLMYTVGGLNTEAAASLPVLYKTVNIGKNPTSIENGNGGAYKNDIFINCRGDKSIYAFQPSGDSTYVLRDSRIEDPVMAENSYNGRGINRYLIHVVDFTGKKVHTYIYKQDFPEPMKFGASAIVPGHPFTYQQDEVP